MWYPWLPCLMGEGYNQPQIIPRAYTLTAFLHSGLCAEAPVLTSWLSTDGRLFSPVWGLVPIFRSIGTLSGTVIVAGPGPDHRVVELIVIQSIAHKMRSILTIKFGTYKYRISFPHIENINSILPSERPFFVKSLFVKPAAFRHSDLSG